MALETVDPVDWALPLTLHRAALCKCGLQIAKLVAATGVWTCVILYTWETHCLCGHSGYKVAADFNACTSHRLLLLLVHASTRPSTTSAWSLHPAVHHSRCIPAPCCVWLLLHASLYWSRCAPVGRLTAAVYQSINRAPVAGAARTTADLLMPSLSVVFWVFHIIFNKMIRKFDLISQLLFSWTLYFVQLDNVDGLDWFDACYVFGIDFRT